MKVISIAPSRISLFGGGTDVDPYASTYGGITLNMAINLRHKIVLNDKSILAKFDNPDFIKSFTSLPVEHTYDNTIESGLGSSAGLAVALAGAVSRYEGKNLSRSQIAEQAWDIEVNKLGLYGGKQDQYCSAYGGVNVMEFNDLVKVTPISPSFIEPLVPYMALFYLGFNRKAKKIQEAFKTLTPEQIKALDTLKAITMGAIEALAEKDISKLADLLKESWEFKKLSNKGVSNEEIDQIYVDGIANGGMAGKLLGSGGGGHILFIVNPEIKKAFIKKEEEKGLKHIDFSIDWNGLETRVIV